MSRQHPNSIPYAFRVKGNTHCQWCGRPIGQRFPYPEGILVAGYTICIPCGRRTGKRLVSLTRGRGPEQKQTHQH